LLEISERFHRFQEGLEVITSLMRSDHPVNYEGKYYQLNEAILLPRPQRVGGPRLMIGGNGIKRTLPLASRFADEWNGIFLSPEEFKKRDSLLNELLMSQGRQPDEIKRSIMTGCVFGRTEDEVAEKVTARTNGKRTMMICRKEDWLLVRQIKYSISSISSNKQVYSSDAPMVGFR
jgi:alkanesulfonate monooxygenase SsuD/methylene tetrahydromethanopterin reductase-like flavin-dependent oxidoreductase (luciferase family)